MSEHIGVVKGLQLRDMGPGLRGDISVNRFWGGSDHGTCVQVRFDREWVQLDAQGVDRLIKYLTCAINGGHKHVCTYCGMEHPDNE